MGGIPVPTLEVEGYRLKIQDNGDGTFTLVTTGGGGGGGGVQYVSGTTQATPTGTVALGIDSSNVLHALSVDGTGKLNVNSTSPLAVSQFGNWTVRIVGNAGVALDVALGGTKPANVLQVGGNDGTNAYAIPLSSGGAKVLVTADAITIAAAQTLATVTTITNPVKITGNTGVALDAVLGATKPANVLQVGGNDGTNAYAIPLSSGGAKILATVDAITIAAAQTLATVTTITNPVKISGDTGVALDAVLGATKPANVLQVGGNDGTNAYAEPLTSGGVSVLTTPGAPTVSKYSQAAITFSASGDNVVIASSGSTTIRVYRIFFVNSDPTNATNITIKDSTPTNLSGAFRLASGGSYGADGEGDPLFVGGSGKSFELNSSTAVQISGTVWYTQS